MRVCNFGYHCSKDFQKCIHPKFYTKYLTKVFDKVLSTPDEFFNVKMRIINSGY